MVLIKLSLSVSKQVPLGYLTSDRTQHVFCWTVCTPLTVFVIISLCIVNLLPFAEDFAIFIFYCYANGKDLILVSYHMKALTKL